MALLADLYRPMMRLGPGSIESNLQALELAGIDTRDRLRVADLGCGTGASALVLAEKLNADIVAVDNLEPFLAESQSRARSRGLHERIHTVEALLDDLPFSEGEFDLMWGSSAPDCAIR